MFTYSLLYVKYKHDAEKRVLKTFGDLLLAHNPHVDYLAVFTAKRRSHILYAT